MEMVRLQNAGEWGAGMGDHMGAGRTGPRCQGQTMGAGVCKEGAPVAASRLVASRSAVFLALPIPCIKAFIMP
jgi:hypothetical protein